MTKFNRIKSAALLFIVAGISIVTIGCSEDSPNGPGGGVAPMDEITVSLSRLYATYDCDNNVRVGGDGSGDFQYSFMVHVKDENGGWELVKSFPQKSVDLDNGQTAEISGRSVTFSLPREDGQQFRVYTMVREHDGGSNYDFTSSDYTIHEFNSGQSQDWKPIDQAYSNYSATTQQGYINRLIHIRSQTKTLGVVTTEGCRVSVRYDVSIKTQN
ncbi:MAG: hypothetical protein GF341_08875 [candidate division Zixibacteria bacterium]|nr:hypothetical protein [candidate division Zixibacteria bacterium]